MSRFPAKGMAYWKLQLSGTIPYLNMKIYFRDNFKYSHNQRGLEINHIVGHSGVNEWHLHLGNGRVPFYLY